ncbi:MAG: PKD domain-containing protein, partial [Flavobacteriales bacterium]
MRKLLLTLTSFVVVVSFSFAQEVVIGTQELLTTCGSAVTDTGAGPGDYGNNENLSITVCPEDGTVSNIYAPVFALGAGDQIEIYDGDDTSAPLIGTYIEDDLQNQSVVASDLNPTGCLTIVFTSDESEVGNFGLVVSCGPPCDRPISVISTDQEEPHRICPGETIDFSAENSVVADGFTLESYVWSFDDGSDQVDGGETVSHTFEETGIYFVQVDLTDDNECTNGNRADFRVEVSNEPVFLADQSAYSLC